MHIIVEQATQQVAANRSRALYPEEIDLVLNKVQSRVVASCLRPKQDGSGGFELDQLKADIVRSLVTQTRLRAYINDERSYRAMLPPDYQYLLGDWSYVTNRCNMSTEAEVSAQTEYITRLPQTRSTKGSPPYYVTYNLQLPGVSLVLPTDVALGNTYVGLPEKEDILLMIPYILSKMRHNNVYWERYDNLYYPGTFIVVTLSTPGATTLTIDGVELSNESISTRSLEYHGSSTTKISNNRLSATDIIPSLNQSKYYRSSHYSPLSELQGENLVIHRDDSFTVSEVGVSYVRKPQPISLSLSSDCELSGEGIHQAICDLAAEYILGTVQNVEGTGLKSADIEKRITL